MHFTSFCQRYVTSTQICYVTLSFFSPIIVPVFCNNILSVIAIQGVQYFILLITFGVFFDNPGHKA